jgi:hypothetical protein
MNAWMRPGILTLMFVLLWPVHSKAGEQQIHLRDFLDQRWTRELLSYPLTVPKGACDACSVTLTGPQGAVPVQLSGITYWPGGRWVKSATFSFITDLAPLAEDTYTVHYGKTPATAMPTELAVTPGDHQVEITTPHFGARVLLGERTFAQPVSADQVPGPVCGMRMADGTWFGGSALYGPGKVTRYHAVLTDSGPVFARAVVTYTYEDGNTLEMRLQCAAGDNSLRVETRVARSQPNDGINLILSRGLPPFRFQVQDEGYKDRACFDQSKGNTHLEWAEIPLSAYTAPKDRKIWPYLTKPGSELITTLTPWEDSFGSFTQARIRLKLEGTTREVQLRSLNPGAWVEPRPIEEIFSPHLDPDPAKGLWAKWEDKLMPLWREPNGDIVLQVNAVQGARIWTISDCLSMPGVAALMEFVKYVPESTFPPATRPTIAYRLNDVKDYILTWKGDVGTHPHMFLSKPELDATWARGDADPVLLKELLATGRAPSPESIAYTPNFPYTAALGAYLLSGGSPEVAAQTQLLARLRQALRYDLYGYQFGVAGVPAPILYDALIDSPVVPAAEKTILRSRMAYYAYRLTDPAVWSAERGYCSGNQNMTVTWEISRGLTACAIPEHPMARQWYRKSEQMMEYFLDHMVGPAGEWPEAMGDHGRQSLDMLLAFAVASTNSGLHDYVNDPRMKRLVLWWAKMETPRDPRARGGVDRGVRPNLRYMPAMGRDRMGGPGATCGVMARQTRTTDPDYSAILQWAWQEEGASKRIVHLGGFSYLACDSLLPAKQPAWTSEVFPYTGAMLRHGLGTPNEHQVLLYSGDHFAAFYPGHIGSFPNIFAYGVPVAGTFPGPYEGQDELLQCHVALAHGVGTVQERTAVAGYHGCAANANMWEWPNGQTARFGEHGGLANVSSFSSLSRQDYAAVDVALHYPRSMRLNWMTDLPAWPPVPTAGKPPVDWRRQVLFLKDDDPANAAYLLIRDTVKGGQPTMWQMWTVSEKIGTPEEVKNLEAFLADKPGHTTVPAHALKGDRFTAIGQLGVDVDYYIAAPTDTPRSTLRYGNDQAFQSLIKLQQPEYQDLLHLQMPGDGAYFVAFFPRKRAVPAPAFTTLGKGLIIKTTGDFGTDYGFLSALEATASGEGAHFTGTAGSVQDRKGGLVLSLGAKGTVQYREISLAADFPCSLGAKAKALTIELPATLQPPAFTMASPFPGGTVTVNAPGTWRLAKPLPGVKFVKTEKGWSLTVPPGIHTVELTPVL